MAAFPMLALLGIAAGAGAGAGIFAGKKLAPKPTTVGQTASASTITPPTPIPTTQASAANTGQAGDVAKKLRRKMGSNTGTRYSTPGQSLITPVTQPRSLIGS